MRVLRQLRLGRESDQPARSVEPRAPVVCRERDDLDFTAAARRVNKPVVADINTDVRERKAARVEEYEIAYLEVCDSNLFPHARELVGRARQDNTRDLLEDIADQAAAVESRLGRIPSEPIIDPDQSKRKQGEILCP